MIRKTLKNIIEQEVIVSLSEGRRRKVEEDAKAGKSGS